MQSDRSLASYRCGLYANSFLRDDQERNHTRLRKVDLVDGLPRLPGQSPLARTSTPEGPFQKAKKRWGGRAASSRFWRCPLDCFCTIKILRGKKVSVALARWFLRPNDSGERTSPIVRPVEAK